MNLEAIRYFRLATASPRLRLPLPRSFDPGRSRRRQAMIYPTTGRAIRHSLFAAGIVAGTVFTMLSPASIYIIEGEIVEYASTCAVPIVHKAGDVAREIHTTSHWWKNNGDKTVVLLSADILHDKSDKNM